MVNTSPWPLIGSLVAMVLAENVVMFLWSAGNILLSSMYIILLMGVMYMWWRDVVRESTFQGCHTSNVQGMIYMGMVVFIASEVMFFFSFFFGYFFISASPDVSLSCEWPPLGLSPLSYHSIPLMNTLLLLSSGFSITWAHCCMMDCKFKGAVGGLIMTIIPGVIFMYMQVEEYFSSSFTIMDSVYGSLFFIMTGFHGLHVLMGMIFIIVSVVRLLQFHFSSSHHLGFEAAAWYWHFVDVVWLFLFICVYWLGS